LGIEPAEAGDVDAHQQLLDLLADVLAEIAAG